MENNMHHYKHLQEFIIKKSLQTMYPEKMIDMKDHRFIYALYSDIKYTTKVIKVRCEVHNNHYRMCINDVFSDERDIPEGTTHIYYDEFIEDNWMMPNSNEIISTPIKFENHRMYFFKSKEKEWILADFGTHIIEDTRYHLLEWCKHDFDHPRLRVMSIGYQVLEYINCMDTYNHDIKSFNDFKVELSRFDVGCYELFKSTINREMGNLVEYFKDVESGYDLINTIINIKTDDVEIKKFVEFVFKYKDLLTNIFSYMKSSTFEFKV